MQGLGWVVSGYGFDEPVKLVWAPQNVIPVNLICI